MAHPFDDAIAVGATVLDDEGRHVGHVRAVYPHYVAVEHPEAPASGYRVPSGAVAAVDGGVVRLSVGLDALDPMTLSEETVEGLPSHGATAPVADLRVTGEDTLEPEE